MVARMFKSGEKGTRKALGQMDSGKKIGDLYLYIDGGGQEGEAQSALLQHGRGYIF